MKNKAMEQYVQKMIWQMKPGETAYTVPWAAEMGPDGSLWLNDRYPVHDDPGGTIQLCITRAGEEFILDGTRLKNYSHYGPYKWIPTSRIPIGYISTKLVGF